MSAGRPADVVSPAQWERVKEIVADAADLPRVERAAYVARACGDDAIVRDEVASMLDYANDETRLDSVADQSTLSGELSGDLRIGRVLGAYRITSELGRGGMGTVYLAERADREFTKQVAIKLLKRGTDTDEVLRRFRAEREILARLEHPTIARLLDAGTADDGLPYFVLEYVVGTRVTDYCFAQNLSVTQRLELFRKICGAVQFAHQNLVVHRDLKPANILITADGEPKLLDFGIAKLLAIDDGSLHLTIADQQRLTPAYASPEQVRGGVITTVSDVYALGVLLYELLVGHSPHKFSVPNPSPTELWQVVGEHTAIRPSLAAPDKQIARRLRGDLDNILLMALRKEPARRYTGVGAFSEDIRRYLHKHPIRARPATAGYRAGKFFSRNKVGSVTAAVALVAFLAGTAATIANARRAESEARRAEVEARRAATHFNDVRKLANSFLFEFHDAIARLPGATSARQLIVGRALQYLDKLVQESTGDHALALELAEAYLKVGDVQGKPYTPNLGDSEGAIRSYAKAAEIVAPLVTRERASGKTEARNVTARAYVSMAAVQARISRLEEAFANNERALAIGEQLLVEDPARSDQWRRLVTACHLGLGDAIQAGNHQRRDPELHLRSYQHYRRALALAEQVVAANPDALGDVRHMAKASGRAAIIGLVGAHTGDSELLDEAIALHARSVALRRQVLARDPANAQDRRTLADAMIMKSATHDLGQRDLQASLAECREALAILSELAAADASNVEAQQDLSFGQYSTGRISQLLGDVSSAAFHYQESLRILQPLVAANPRNVETAFDHERAQRALQEIAELQRSPDPSYRQPK